MTKFVSCRPVRLKLILMDNEKKQQLSIEIRPDVARGSYSNLVIVAHSRSEFILDFVTRMPGMSKVEVSNRIVMAPEHCKRLLNVLKRFFLNPANVILVVFLLVLLFMIFYPLFTLIVSTFSVSSIQETAYGVMIGQRTGLWWQRLFASDVSTLYFWKPLLNSILMSLLASIIAILYGGVVAFFITRTNMKGKKINSFSWQIKVICQRFQKSRMLTLKKGR